MLTSNFDVLDILHHDMSFDFFSCVVVLSFKHNVKLP